MPSLVLSFLLLSFNIFNTFVVNHLKMRHQLQEILLAMASVQHDVAWQLEDQSCASNFVLFTKKKYPLHRPISIQSFCHLCYYQNNVLRFISKPFFMLYLKKHAKEDYYCKTRLWFQLPMQFKHNEQALAQESIVLCILLAERLSSPTTAQVKIHTWLTKKTQTCQ